MTTTFGAGQMALAKNTCKQVVFTSMRGSHGSYAASLVWELEKQQASVLETLADRRRIIRKDGSEVVALRIRWRDFTDKEIGAVMERFARAHRPRNAAFKAPQRKGHGKRDEVQSALDA